MIVRAAGDDAESRFGNFGSQFARVRNDLFGVFAESRIGRFLQAHRFGGDDMHQRPALRSGKSDAVEFLRKLRLAKHESAARSAQSFVSRRGNEIGMRHWARMHAS